MTPRTDAVAAALEAALGTQVERDAPSADLTTYRVGGRLAVLVRVRSESELAAVSAVVASHEPSTLVVGRGSNLLVADRGFDGVALLLEGTFEDLAIDATTGVVHAGASLALPVLARRAAGAGLAGLEFYVGIPGSVGGAIRMNAGGHGRETKEVLRRARVHTLAGGTTRELDVGDLELGYRRSNLGPADVVVSATFAGQPDDVASCEARIDEIVRWRRANQPGGANAGSVFTNPPDDSAGRLIDACGLKGARVGCATVSTKHANFIQADPGASADDVIRLVKLVQARVEARTGVHLEPELQLVGFEGEL